MVPPLSAKRSSAKEVGEHKLSQCNTDSAIADSPTGGSRKQSCAKQRSAKRSSADEAGMHKLNQFNEESDIGG